jgi:hypothetical protein
MTENAPILGSATGFRRTRPTWLLVATARPCVLPVFDHADHFRVLDEPKSARPPHEPYKWMNRIRSDHRPTHQGNTT